MNKQTVAIVLILALGVLGVMAILRSEPGSAGAGEHDEHGHGAAEHGAEEHGAEAAGHEEEGHPEEEGEEDHAEVGPHGGRLLTSGEFALEVTIFEDEVEPEFRLYPYRSGKPIAPGAVQATVTLTRLGGRTEQFRFASEQDYLRGAGTVAEPHSFDVVVAATMGGQRFDWQYAAPESRVEIPAAVAAASGLKVATAAPAEIRETLVLYGSVAVAPGRERQVTARFPGVVRDVRVHPGDRVGSGQVLAIIESNESLEDYPVRSPIGGIVLARDVNPGDVAADQVLFRVADLASVTAELAVFRRDLPRVRIGQRVRVRTDDGQTSGEGTVSFVSPVGSSASQTVLVRVGLDNADGRWQPGMFVTGEVEVGVARVPVAVEREALQTWNETPVVFVNAGNFYEPQPVELGRSDGTRIEVRAGLQAGATYVARNSFLVKADIGKSGAGHDH